MSNQTSQPLVDRHNTSFRNRIKQTIRSTSIQQNILPQLELKHHKPLSTFTTNPTVQHYLPSAHTQKPNQLVSSSNYYSLVSQYSQAPNHKSNHNFSQILEITFPPQWDYQTEMCELNNLSPNSQEYAYIGGLVHDSMPNQTLSSIQRIQNIHLWRRYFLEQKCVQQNHGDANEMDLFHGSGSLLPEEIYNSEEGYPLTNGRWGNSIQFTDSASYAYTNAYSNTKNQTFQILLNKVIIGTPYFCRTRANYTKPPPKDTPSLMGFHTDHYDSVYGIESNSNIYSVYRNSKVYPSYLISLPFDQQETPQTSESSKNSGSSHIHAVQ